MSPTAITLSGRGVLDRACGNPQRQSPARQEVTGPGFDDGSAEGFSDKAGRRCSAGRRLGSGRPPTQHKSIAGGSLFPAPAAIVPDQEPESHDAGVSGNAGTGSHLEATDVAEGHAGQVGRSGSSGNAGIGSHPAEVDAAEGHARQVGRSGGSGNVGIGSHLEATGAAEGHAGQVDGPGSSGNTGIGSHLATADFSDEPRVVMWRHTPPRRTESGLLLYGTPPQDSAVQETALWCTRGPP